VAVYPRARRLVATTQHGPSWASTSRQRPKHQRVHVSVLHSPAPAVWLRVRSAGVALSFAAARCVSPFWHFYPLRRAFTRCSGFAHSSHTFYTFFTIHPNDAAFRACRSAHLLQSGTLPGGMEHHYPTLPTTLLLLFLHHLGSVGAGRGQVLWQHAAGWLPGLFWRGSFYACSWCCGGGASERSSASITAGRRVDAFPAERSAVLPAPRTRAHARASPRIFKRMGSFHTTPSAPSSAVTHGAGGTDRTGGVGAARPACLTAEHAHYEKAQPPATLRDSLPPSSHRMPALRLRISFRRRIAMRAWFVAGHSWRTGDWACGQADAF